MSSPNLPRTVLVPPSQYTTSGGPETCPYSTLRNKAKFNEIVHVNAVQCQEQAHTARMKSMRKELLEYLKNTEWKYDPIESYIGQS